MLPAALKISPLFLFLFLIHVGPALASGKAAEAAEAKPAILLASFGTTVPSGVKALDNIARQVRKAYPATEVRITFTSNMVRAVWKKRREEGAQKWLDQGIPAEVLQVKNIIQTMGDLQEDGYRDIVVQPTHVFFMEQSYDLAQYVEALASIKTIKAKWRPFARVVMGRPALGMPGDNYSYHTDIDRVVETLAADAAMAEQEGAILLYMAHGNENWSTGVYAETEKRMRQVYPRVQTFIGVVEGTPSLDDLMAGLRRTGLNKVVLRPFMITAGDHAVNDMAGDDKDSWKSQLTAVGFAVHPVLTGLGQNDAFAGLFVEHIADAASEAGIVLK